MTVTLPTSAPRVLSRGTRARARGVFAIAAILVMAVSPSAASAIAAPGVAASLTAPESATPSPTPSPVPATGEAVFTLSPVGNGTVRPGESLAVSVSLENGTDAATPPAGVTLALGATAIRDRAALTRWLTGETTGVSVAAVGSAELPGVAAGGEEVRGIGVAADDPVLAGRAAGVYPLVATYDSPDGPVTSTSAMIVPAASPSPVGIGVIVPITAGVNTEGLLTQTRLAELTSPTGSLSNQLDAVDGTTSILAIDPAIPAAIRVLGSAAPATATEWLARLEALPNSRFALQFGDADVAAQLQSGLSQPARPLSLQAYMNPVDFTSLPETSPSPIPTATSDADADAVPDADPTGPVFPTLAQLTDIGGERAGVYWPGTGTATPAVVATLGGIAVDERASLTLVPSTSTVAGADGSTVPGHAVAGDADVLVYDADISSALHGASLSDSSALRGASLTAAAAYLSFAVAESGGEPIVVTLDRAADRSRVAMATAITSVSQAPGVTALSLGGVAARPPAAVEIADAAADDARAAAASALFAGEAALSRFATILDDTTLLTGPERAEILQVLSLAWLPDAAAWQSALQAHRLETTATLDSVGILPPTPINLASAGAPIPIWVRNDLPYPVNVVLYAAPDDLRLDVTQATEVTATADSNTRVQVPVRARVGNGDVSVQLQLRSRTLEPIGAAQVVDVNVRADWEGIGIIILSVLVGGFLLLGVVRTVLRIRRGSGRPRSDGRDDEGSTSEPVDAAGATKEPDAAGATKAPAGDTNSTTDPGKDAE